MIGSQQMYSAERWRKVRLKGWSAAHTKVQGESGSALIVVLWVLLLMSLMIVTFAYEMKIEGQITGYYRNRMKAEFTSRAGVEWAKVLLWRSMKATQDDEEEDELGAVIASINLNRGVAVSGLEHEIGGGKFTLDIVPEQGRRNVNLLSDEDWEEILDQANVPEDTWEDIIDCFTDWTDDNDLAQLNGAESDDEFYEERGYKCKNAPVDTIDELALIKSFDARILYGGPGFDEDDSPITGIAQWLTAYGDGKVNINTASREVLLTLPGIDEFGVDAILEGRLGLDGESGTKDDGFTSIDQAMTQGGLDPSLRGTIGGE